ncbi:Uncharacterised protein [uncultured archaeon]|nr:Uncharacterised protein [uncultured archaeon]
MAAVRPIIKGETRIFSMLGGRMEFIDSKGRLFGKVNLIDALVVLAAVFILIVGFNLLFVGRPTSWTYVTLRLVNQPSYVLDAVSVGDVETSSYLQGSGMLPVRKYLPLVGSRGKEVVIAEIESMKAVPSYNNSKLSDVTLGVRLLTEQTYFDNKPAFKQLQVLVGRDVCVDTGKIKFCGTVLSMSSNKSAQKESGVSGRPIIYFTGEPPLNLMEGEPSTVSFTVLNYAGKPADLRYTVETQEKNLTYALSLDSGEHRIIDFNFTPAKPRPKAVTSKTQEFSQQLLIPVSSFETFVYPANYSDGITSIIRGISGTQLFPLTSVARIKLSDLTENVPYTIHAVENTTNKDDIVEVISDVTITRASDSVTVLSAIKETTYSSSQKQKFTVTVVDEESRKKTEISFDYTVNST